MIERGPVRERRKGKEEVWEVVGGANGGIAISK